MVDRIGPYQVVRELGRGGMGVVYEGRAPDGQQVAIKVLLDAGLDAELRLRFQTEIQACAALQHPNVVRLLDAGQAPKPYLVMELLEGETLEQRLRRTGPLPVPEAVALTAELARALQMVHDHGILHRDLKPSNVFLCPGRSVITDFGLARDPARERERLTATGQMLGTPAYMAPEQACGEKDALGPWTDVYCLGAVLYQCLTGGPPFVGSQLSVLDQVLNAAPQPTQVGGGKLDAIVLRCLAKRPGDRFSDAGALAAALESYATSGSERSWGRGLIAAALPIAIGAAGVGLVVATRRPAEPAPEPTAARAEPLPPLAPPKAPAPSPRSRDQLNAELVTKAERLFESGRRAEVLELLDRIPEEESSGEAWVLKGRALLQGGAITQEAQLREAARKAFERALEHDSVRVEALRRLALSGEDQPEWLKRARSLAGNTSESALGLAIEGFEELKRSRREPRGSLESTTLGWSALLMFERAVKLDEHCLNAWRGRFAALTQLAAGSRQADAFEALEEAVTALQERFKVGNAEPIYLAAYAFKEFGTRRKEDALIERAITLFSQAIDREPRYAAAYLERSYSLFRLKRLPPALRDVDRAIALAPQWDHPRSIRGLVLNRSGKLQAAESSLTGAIERSRGRRRQTYQVQRAFMREKLGDLIGAAKDLTGGWRSLAPRDQKRNAKLRARILDGARIARRFEAHFAAREWHEAQGVLIDASHDRFVQLALARIAVDRESYLQRPKERAKGTKLLRRVVSELPDHLEAHAWLALLDVSFVPAAVKLVERLGARGKLAAVVRVAQARAVASERGAAALGDVRRMFMEAISFDSACVQAWVARLQLERGMLNIDANGREQRVKNLKQSIDQALRSLPGHPMVLKAAAEALEATLAPGSKSVELSKQVDALLTRAVKAEPRFPSAWARRAEVRLAQGRLEDAVSDLAKAAEVASWDPTHDERIAIYYLQNKKYPEAEAQASRCLKRRETVGLLQLRARARTAQGKTAEAVRDQTRAEALQKLPPKKARRRERRLR